MFGYIYKIWDNDDPSLVYYGSTKQQVSIRMGKHRTIYNACSSKIIIERNNYQYATIEKIEYEDKFELHNRERWYIENNICVNKSIPNQTTAEYRKKNKQQIAERSSEYQTQNKQQITIQRKNYYETNKERLLDEKKEYFIKNKQRILNKKKQKITCECGCIVRYDGMLDHKKTQKHLKKILLK